jgi:hypothetical protein
MQIYATMTVSSNQIGLPLALKNKALSGMHYMILWNGGCTKIVGWYVFFGKIRNPIGYLCMPMPIVPKKNGTVQEDIMTSPIYLEYIIHMCGVDVMN